MPAGTCSVTSRASTIPAACTQPWATSARRRRSVARLNPVHFFGGRSDWAKCCQSNDNLSPLGRSEGREGASDRERPPQRSEAVHPLAGPSRATPCSKAPVLHLPEREGVAD